MTSPNCLLFETLFILWTFLHLPCLIEYNASPPESLKSGQASSLWCDKPCLGMKTCRFKNLYYNRSHGFLFMLTNKSVISGLEDYRDFQQLKMSPIADHPGVHMKLNVIDRLFLNEGTRLINDPLFLLYRFKPDNFMHVIHDDLIPLFHKFKTLCFGEVRQCLTKYVLLVADDNPKGPFFQWYKALSFKEPFTIAAADAELTYCFSLVVSGVANTSFFQYGFKIPQGPVEVKLTGGDLREFRNFYLEYFNVTTPQASTTPYKATLISRSVNRKIINEDDVCWILRSAVSQASPGQSVEIAKIDLIMNTTSDVLHSVASSNILIGMHGAESLLALFLPDASVFIEMFPLGISAENVSPVYALSRAQGVHFAYISWHNHREDNSIVHPEYPPELGGLSGYSNDFKLQIYHTKKIQAVECCKNPFYLFRMYQDTFVDESFADTISLAIHTLKHSKLLKVDMYANWFFPGPVQDLNCVRHLDSITISWAPPLNTHQAVFSIVLLVGPKYLSLSTQGLTMDVPVEEAESKIQVWVRSLYGVKESVDAYVECG